MVVYLVPAGAGRFELYAEAVDEPSADAPSSRLGRAVAAAIAGWHRAVEHARTRERKNAIGRSVDAAICRLADRLAEQRGLGSLRGREVIIVRFPSNLPADRVEAETRRGLDRTARHHRWRCVLYLALFVVSGVLAILPGPNLLAYYFAIALFGHLQAWRGATHAATGVRLLCEADAGLADLSGLVDVPRAAREAALEAIAARMNVPRLAAFFDRVAAPSS